MSLPSGTVTFLFTDVEGSTRLFEQLGEGYHALIERHFALIRASLAAHGGSEVKSLGDGLFVAFDQPAAAVAAAAVAQLAHMREDWPKGAAVRARMGLHTGEAIPVEGDYAAFAVHQASRIADAAHGGQVLVSGVTHALLDGGLPPGVSFADLGEHRLKDLTAPQRLFQLCHPELLGEFPPLRTLDQVPHNLPIQLTSFVGREGDISEVQEFLDQARLVTLTGAGGCGKTRLALHVAAEVAERHPAGVWFVDLASITDAELVVGEVAAALRVREEPGRDLLELVFQRVGDREALFVLDNCEHLLARCAEVTEGLVRACPSVRVLATSREALRVPGEIAWRVPSLPVPESVGPTGLEVVDQSPSVQLFLERARAVAPDFAPTGEEATAVADICRRLDGIPLAIELAAARMDALSATQINRRLDDRFRLLTGGARSALERQRTLRAAVDWSHDLLGEAERVVFRRLSVFTGGFTLEAAEDVCCSDELGAAPVAREDVLDLLTGLVRKSLALAERRDGDVRYRMLETVRQYAAEKLAESGESPATRDRHRDWFLALAEEFDSGGYGRQEPAWLSRLEDDHDNLVAALEWSLASDEPEPALRLVGALTWFWEVHAHYAQARRFAEEAVERSSGGAAEHRARALYVVGRFAWRLHDLPAARRVTEDSLALYRTVGSAWGEAQALNILANVVVEEGEFEHARVFQDEALALFRQVGDQLGVAMMLGNMGAQAMRRGEFDDALALTEEAVEYFARLGGNLRAEAMYRGNLASVLEALGDYHRAVTVREEALAAARELGDPLLTFMNVCEHAKRLEALGDLARAREALEEAGRLAGQMGEERGLAWVEATLGGIAADSGDREEALVRFGRAVELAGRAAPAYVETAHRARVAMAEGRLDDWAALVMQVDETAAPFEIDNRLARMIETAYAVEWSGDRDRSTELATKILDDPAGGVMHSSRAVALNILGRLEAAGGDGAAASALHREALEAAVAVEWVAEIAAGLDGLGAVAGSGGQASEAGRFFGAAEALRGVVGLVVPPFLQGWREQMVAGAREVDRDAFDAAVAAAQAMTRQDVLTLARAIVEGPT